MKTIELGEAAASLGSYAKQLQGAPLVVTSKGAPVAVLVPLTGIDLEALSLSTNPDFLDILKHSDAEYRKHSGIPIEEVRRQFGMETTPATARVKRKPKPVT